MKKIITIKNAPEPVGPYSQAILQGDTLYSSGQIAIDPKTNSLILDSIEKETHQVMKNLINVLEQSGSSLERVTFVRVYLVNFQDFDKVNKIYKSYFNEEKLPARTCIGVTGLAVGASVEIDLIAKI